MKVLTFPHPHYLTKLTDGISQVVHHYTKYLPEFGVELVDPNAESFDLVAGHVGQGMDKGGPYVLHTHGLHWTADLAYGPTHYATNARIVEAARRAQAITVPSGWVAETFQRDMRLSPYIVPHGIDWDGWQHKEPVSDYVLWNKNRSIGVCDPSPVVALARRFPKGHFVTTFLPYKTQKPNNTNVTGLIPHGQMKRLVQSAAVYLSTTKETFGIGTLEALASGVPVLGYNWGGNVELVQHGVNGYLAQPGDMDDLERGMRYCIKHRRVLSLNARESARAWTWREVVEAVAGIYRLAAQERPPTVAVVIPVYNKLEAELRRAIDSVINQTMPVQRIVIVDDGSDTGSAIEGIVSNYQSKGHPITYRRRSNSGVAIARNAGIADCGSKYVCPLDSDDWLDPDFIRRCVNELERDPTLAIAYTGLTWHKPDGTEGLSDWPGDWDFDQQLQRHNQVPTCCVFRREMWERLGGYRQRYAPEGCGQEDAEFWLRAGAYGFKARKITKKGLFHYSWLSGLVSGNRQHKEVDWTGWHPWTKDRKHPFASYATPVNISHPVRQYDEPTVSVVIPVGPGHASNLINALDSLESQTFRGWEVIVSWDYDVPDDEYQQLKTAYPYIREAWSVENGQSKGAGYARNLGAEMARGAFLLFLDADDALHPDALDGMLTTWNEYRGIIYTDYVGRAIIGNVDDLAPDLRARIYDYNERTQEAVIGYRGLDYDCGRAQSQPPSGKERPYLWCNVTALIPTAWHVEVGGFDENMTSWEDVDYHWRLAKRGYCYYRIPAELMVYNFHTGNRRENGRQIHAELLEYLREKHQEIETMPCSSCGGRARSPATLRASSTFARDAQVERVSDNDFIEVRYMAGKGLHQVTGAATFNHRFPNWPMLRRGPELWSLQYGRRQGGDKFLVHQDDIRMMPGKFMPIEAAVAVADAPRVKRDVRPPEPLAEIPPEELEPPTVSADDAQELVDDILTPPFDLQTLPGISSSMAMAMKESDITDADDVLRAGVAGLMTIKGIGEKRAEMILRAAAGQ